MLSEGRATPRFAAWRVLAIAGLLWGLAGWVHAAESPVDALRHAFPQGLSAEQAEAVVGLMDERVLRTTLRDRLTAPVPAAATSAAPETPLDYYSRRIDEIALAYSQLPSTLSASFARPRGLDLPIDPVRLGWLALLLIAAGTAAKLLVGRLTAGWHRVAKQSRPGDRAAAALLSLLLDLVEVGAFLLGAIVLYAVLRPVHPLAPSILFVILRAAAIILIANALLRFLCAPHPGQPRLLPLPAPAARALYRTLLTVTVLLASATAVARVLLAVGTPPDAIVAVVLPLSALPFLFLLVVILRGRRAISATVAEQLRIDLARTPLLSAWPVLGTAGLIALWLVIADAIIRVQSGTGPRAVASILVLACIPLGAFLIQPALTRAYAGRSPPAAPLPPGNPADGPLPAAAATAATGEDDERHVSRFMRAIWLVLLVFAVVLIARIWGFDPSAHDGLGGLAVRILFNAGVVLLLGYVGWALIVRALDRALERSRGSPGTARAQRMATLVPLFRKVLLIAMMAILGMIVLSSLGIEIGPLLAGAGVVGIAVGLGAQSTINDILSGVFFLLEDAFRMGDYVEVGSLRGQVEGISLRSLKLRHHRGPVHTLPFGQIKSLTNYTRDWALTRLEFRVAPETDLGLVKKLVRQIGEQLSADPELGPAFIEPLKSQGVRRVEDNAIIIGIKYIAKPGSEQFVIRREAYHRLLAAFQKNGIELVGRGVVVKVEGPDVPPAAIGAAASEALQKLGPASAA